MLSAKRDVSAAKRFFKRLMKADHRKATVHNWDGQACLLPRGVLRLRKRESHSRDCKLRRVKYLNNVIEQDQRAIRRMWRAAQGFWSFHAAERMLEGHRSHAHAEEWAGQEAGRQGRSRAVEVRRGAARCRCLMRAATEPFSPQSNSCNATPFPLLKSDKRSAVKYVDRYYNRI